MTYRSSNTDLDAFLLQLVNLIVSVLRDMTLHICKLLDADVVIETHTGMT